MNNYGACVLVDAEDLRHMSTILSTMASEKQKAKVRGGMKSGHLIIIRTA